MRSKEGHIRITTIQGRDGPFGIAMRLSIRHKKPDGEVKRVGAEYIMNPTHEHLARQALSSIEEGHEMMDQWAYAGTGILTMEEEPPK